MNHLVHIHTLEVLNCQTLVFLPWRVISGAEGLIIRLFARSRVLKWARRSWTSCFGPVWITCGTRGSGPAITHHPSATRATDSCTGVTGRRESCICSSWLIKWVSDTHSHTLISSIHTRRHDNTQFAFILTIYIYIQYNIYTYRSYISIHALSGLCFINTVSCCGTEWYDISDVRVSRCPQSQGHAASVFVLKVIEFISSLHSFLSLSKYSSRQWHLVVTFISQIGFIVIFKACYTITI